MKKDLIRQIIQTGRTATQQIAKMTPSEKKHLEESWDVEHAYYSSALEGSKLDRKEFEDIAEKTK
jgi:hypothetical protein